MHELLGTLETMLHTHGSRLHISVQTRSADNDSTDNGPGAMSMVLIGLGLANDICTDIAWAMLCRNQDPASVRCLFSVLAGVFILIWQLATSLHLSTLLLLTGVAFLPVVDPIPHVVSAS